MNITMAAFNRLPLYLKALQSMKKSGVKNVSSVAIADAVRENPSVVKSDLSGVITCAGRPKIGYEIDSLIEDIENFLGYNNVNDAILVGAGKLGQALMGYKGFGKYGLNIIAAFDINDDVIGRQINGIKVLPTGKIQGTVERLNIKIAVLCTNAEHAQAMTDVLVGSGVRAIWNFTATHLNVSEKVILKNEDLAANLALLALQLKDMLKTEHE